MPLTTRIFNFIEGLDPNDIGVGEKLVQRFEKLVRGLRGKANRAQLTRAYNGEPANFGLQLGGMDELHDLKALGEYLGFDDPFATEDRLVRAQAVINFQSEGDVLGRIAEVGTPSKIQDQLSEFIGNSIRDIESAAGGFSSGGVNKSLNLFLNNYLTENRIFSVKDLPESGDFLVAAGNFVALLESKERIANHTRILNAYDPNNPDDELLALATANEQDVANQAQLMQQEIDLDRQTVNQVMGSNPDSLIVRSYKQAIDTQFIEGYENVDVSELSFSLIPDDAWEVFLTGNEFSPEVREFFETHKDMVEEAYDSRPDKTVAFNTWSFRDYAPEAAAIQERFSPVQLGWRSDRTLDPLVDEFLSGVPVAFRAQARDRFREFIAAVRQGPNKDKSALWVEFVNGQHGETPDQVLNRYIADVISSKPGGREFVEAARTAGIQLATLASDSGDPVDWLKSITDGGAALGLPAVAEADLQEINTRAWAIEMFASDPDMRDAPAIVREEVYTEITRQLRGQGLDPLTSGNRLDYVQAVSRVGIGNIKSNVLESIVRNSGPEGDALWEDLKRKQADTGTLAPDSILSVFNDIEGLDKNTLLIGNLNAQLEETAKTLGPTPEEAARAGFAELTRNLPSEFQGTANARIQTFLNSFVGEDPEAVLARQDVQDRIALIVEGVGQQILGESEVVELAVAQFGGLNEFFAAFPELQESDVGTIQDFVVDNFDTILAGAGPDAEVAELQKAKARVEQERLRDELTQRREALNLEAEGRALEFDESAQGRQLAQLQETESRRQEQLSVFNPELERAVRGTISGPAASQVLQDVGPQLQRQFLAQREATFAAQQAGTDALDISPQDFLGQLDQDFFIKERRRSNIRRSPVNVAAPQFAGLGSTNDGPGFSRQGGR